VGEGYAAHVSLSDALRGVRGLLLDLDGVLTLRGAALPGAKEAVARLDARGMPFRIMTNTSAISRESIAGFGQRAGFSTRADQITSALSVTAAWTVRRFPGQALFVLATEDARTEFAGQRLLTLDEMAANHPAAAVVIGDDEAAVRYDVLNAAFRLVRDGAPLIAMHRNPWWLTADGPRIDSGAWVAALEYATGRRATVLGKPAVAFFRAGLRSLPGGPRADEVAMVGDDVDTDVLAAQRLGMRGIFVRSGKHGDAELAVAALRGRGGGRPDAVADSLLDVVAALD
jgi:HAD superfamily hydrolase (TIGR01458 family)